MAEWYYNFYFWKNTSRSAALVEDRREKYNFSPSTAVQKSMEDDGINISKQKIKLVSLKMCKNASKIIILSDTKDAPASFSISWKNPLEFIYKNYSHKVIIFPVPDPYTSDTQELIFIRDSIKQLYIKMK